jgi:hypothetical protein
MWHHDDIDPGQPALIEQAALATGLSPVSSRQRPGPRRATRTNGRCHASAPGSRFIREADAVWASPQHCSAVRWETDRARDRSRCARSPRAIRAPIAPLRIGIVMADDERIDGSHARSMSDNS